MKKLEFVIVTGMSGSGKSVVMNALEDIGFYCIDNMPPALISSFALLCMQSTGGIDRVAVVADIRGKEFFNGAADEISNLKRLGIEYKVLFVDTDDTVLKKRYKETRRRHPLAVESNISITEALQMERRELNTFRATADFVLDTTHFSPAQTREKVAQLFLDNSSNALIVNCMSFGFKYGIPTEADLVFDVRCFPNPFYVPELKNLTGLDEPVKNYVFQSDATKGFLTRLFDMVSYMLPLYISEGKSQLVIGIGCTGGKHRSVAIAQALHDYLHENGQRAAVIHRDIPKQ